MMESFICYKMEFISMWSLLECDPNYEILDGRCERPSPPTLVLLFREFIFLVSHHYVDILYTLHTKRDSFFDVATLRAASMVFFV
jgi:hypothetical protein